MNKVVPVRLRRMAERAVINVTKKQDGCKPLIILPAWSVSPNFQQTEARQ